MNRHVRLDEKLTALQEADSCRKWYSLDDRRICILSNKIITGRMVDVWQDQRSNYHLHCPTPGCSATPGDWFYHSAGHLLSPKVPKSRERVISYDLSRA